MPHEGGYAESSQGVAHHEAILEVQWAHTQPSLTLLTGHAPGIYCGDSTDACMLEPWAYTPCPLATRLMSRGSQTAVE